MGGGIERLTMRTALLMMDRDQGSLIKFIILCYSGKRALAGRSMLGRETAGNLSQVAET